MRSSSRPSRGTFCKDGTTPSSTPSTSETRSPRATNRARRSARSTSPTRSTSTRRSCASCTRTPCRTRASTVQLTPRSKLRRASTPRAASSSASSTRPGPTTTASSRSTRKPCAPSSRRGSGCCATRPTRPGPTSPTSPARCRLCWCRRGRPSSVAACVRRLLLWFRRRPRAVQRPRRPWARSRLFWPKKQEGRRRHPVCPDRPCCRRAPTSGAPTCGASATAAASWPSAPKRSAGGATCRSRRTKRSSSSSSRAS
mmetsp:Transcript_21358/g.84949  ORF Transcript_21358/g.84949 Transcript_21358/m.84949 type:complete len:256 (+) Transcript_21358:268-1035(+)